MQIIMARLTPGVCFTLGITNQIKAISIANKTHFIGPIKILTIPSPIYEPAVAAKSEPANN